MIGYSVIGGWLGSGKTTLVNRLLIATPAGGERIAVVVNDVGEINVDAALIRSRGTQTIELTNGCVCCSIGGSLAVTLRELVIGTGPDHRAPDRIIVEASGVADPAKVASYGDRRVLRLDGVIVTIDCLDILRRLADETYGPMVRHQILGADVLVVTKTDIASADQILAVHNWCRTNAPGTPLIEPDAVILSELSRRTNRRSEPNATTSNATSNATAPTVLLETRTWLPNGAVDLSAVLSKLREADIVRAKGKLRGLDGTEQLVQFSQGGESIEPVAFDMPEGLVLIAEEANLDRFLRSATPAPSATN